MRRNNRDGEKIVSLLEFHCLVGTKPFVYDVFGKATKLMRTREGMLYDIQVQNSNGSLSR